ncbi:MAG TPA: hypothetical protein VJ779_09685 [Acetobacteraceae bacterium]|nr:hypothetical protein [Acetobacteraceae bacterium]
MTRFGSQPDLFTQAARQDSTPPAGPLAELDALLARLRAARSMPWADAAVAMAEELRALGLARQAGVKGETLAAAILRETERLLALRDSGTSEADPDIVRR